MNLNKLGEFDVSMIFCLATGETMLPQVEFKEIKGLEGTKVFAGQTIVAYIKDPSYLKVSHVMTINTTAGVNITDVLSNKAIHVGNQFEIIDYIRGACE